MCEEGDTALLRAGQRELADCWRVAEPISRVRSVSRNSHLLHQTAVTSSLQLHDVTRDVASEGPSHSCILGPSHRYFVMSLHQRAVGHGIC